MLKHHINEILKEYDKKRMTNAHKKELRIKEVYEKIPRIREIDSEINRTGISLSRAILNGANDPEEILEDLQNRLEKLRQEKAILLTENNIPLSYLDDEYDCTKCHDRGYTSNGSRCVMALCAVIFL